MLQMLISEVLHETLKILLIVLALMILTEYLELRFKGKIQKKITELVGFGALVAVMVATAGDEAFVMLAMMPRTALLIFAICMVLGVVAGFLADGIARKVKLKTCPPCEIEIHEEELSTKHFLKEHVYNHIIKRHLPRLFLWLFFTMLAINILMSRFDLGAILPQNKLLLIFLAALIGIIPESGPHLIFLLLFVEGLIPFSVLLVSSIVQDGHGLLPLLSYSVKDTFYVKAFNVAFGLVVGLILFCIGV